jgi:hypothetical protein
MSLPFKTLRIVETVEVAGFALPKRGCLTVSEEVAIRDLGANLEKICKGMNELQADIELKQQVVTILFQSRLDKSWTLEKTRAPEWEIELSGQRQLIEPDMLMLDALYEFFITEQRRGKPLERAEAAESGSANGSPKKSLTGVKSSGSSS